YINIPNNNSSPHSFIFLHSTSKTQMKTNAVSAILKTPLSPTHENHSDSRILSDSDKGQTMNIPNTICVSIKPTKSHGIPGHGPTVGFLVLDPIGSDV
ncbi:unnamed protein product, partial [Rotaria magnacalcarata]